MPVILTELIQCTHCLEAYLDHAEAKCLYEPTWFEPSKCLICKCAEMVVYYEIVRVNDCHYFFCTPCVTKLMPKASERIRADFKALALDILRHERDVECS